MAFERIDEHLSFDKDTHRFKIDGRLVPSVTGILKSCGLIDDRWFDDYYANRGSAVHETIQFYEEGDLDESTLDPVLAGYLAGWKKFRGENKYYPSGMEIPVYRIDLQYAGIVDQIGYWGEDKEFITIDIKSGAVPWWAGIQLAAYQGAMERAVGLRLVVQVSQDGTYKPYWFKDRRDWKDFQACLHVEHLKRRNTK